MKKAVSVIILICMLLTACSDAGIDESTDADGTTEEIVTAAPDGTYIRNPLNGKKLNEAYNGRVVAVTINNVSPALPHRSVDSADIYFEMFINDYCTRGLALYSDIKNVGDIGSIRSTRYNFTDIALAYDTVLVHANASREVLDDMAAENVDNILADVPVGYRDTDRTAAGYSYEHTLFATGESIYTAIESKGFSVENNNRDYGMSFEDEVELKNAVSATEVEIVFTLHGNKKITEMKYDSATDTYVYWQYSKEMIDEAENSSEDFKNVIVILAPTENQGVYHVAELDGSGSGYFACSGKMIPIKWSHSGKNEPFRFTLEDGTPLVQEAGSTYIAIAPTGSAVNAH